MSNPAQRILGTARDFVRFQEEGRQAPLRQRSVELGLRGQELGIEQQKIGLQQAQTAQNQQRDAQRLIEFVNAPDAQKASVLSNQRAQIIAEGGDPSGIDQVMQLPPEQAMEAAQAGLQSLQQQGVLKAPAQAPQRQITADALGRKRFPDTGELVFPDVQVPEKSPESIAADLGLAKAKTAKILADTKALEADTQQSILELEALKQGNIPIPSEDRFNMEKKLRDEATKQIGESVKIEESFRRLQASDDSAAGDLALIFSFMKMLDPGSVVRETEFANAQNAAGVPDRIQNVWNKVLSGERLTVTQRKNFRGQAKKISQASKQRRKDVKTKLGPVIKNYGLNADNIFGPPDKGPLTPEEIAGMTDEQKLARIAELEAQQ